MTTFDDLLDEVGTFGRCQKRILALLSLVSLPYACAYVGIVFQGFTPDHWCRDPAVVEMRQACGWSLADSRRLTVPLVNSSGVLQHSSCEQYEVDWNTTMLTCDTQELNLTEAPVTTCKDGWEYQYGGRKPLVTENLTRFDISITKNLDQRMTTFDDLLDEVGTFGRYQKRIFALLCLVSLPFAGVDVSIVFQGFTPDHWCRDPAVVEMRQACGWSLADSRRLTVPLVNSSGVLQHSSCEQYEVDWNTTMLTCDTRELNLTDVPVTTCKDGWEYQYQGRKSLVTEFNLVCSDAWLVDMYQSILNAGNLVGGFAFGYFSDRFGRRISILMSNMLNLITGFVLAVTPNIGAILVVRCIFGFGINGGWMTSYVLLTEMVGVENRRTVGILFQMFYSVGILILPLLAYLITDWRWLQAVITAPYILFMSYFWFVPESPRWLISQKKYSEALEITEAMAKENKKKLSTNFETLTGDEDDSSSVSVLDLIRTPNMRKHTFILMFNWFAIAVVYQGLVMRIGILGGNVYIDFLISGLMEFPAALIILLTIERFGRRLPFASANIIAGASCFITAFIPDHMFWLKTVTACIGRFGVTMAILMVMFVNAELYPTFVRNLGVSVCSTLSEIGGIVAPFLLYRLAAIWLELPLIIFGVFELIAGGLVLLLPETRGVPLPDTIDDVEFPNRKKGAGIGEPTNEETFEIRPEKQQGDNCVTVL